MSDEKTFSPEKDEIQGENSDTASAESSLQEAEIPTTMPLLAVRDIVVFNYMILPLFVGREKSVQAVDAALNGSRYIFISTQKDEAVDDPAPDDLYT
nr:endopeptidase La [Desulfomicrobium sp.]